MYMEQRILGKTGLSISTLAFGGIVVRDTAAAEAANQVAEAVDRGINYFDVAPSYGNAQEILGPALEPHRPKVYLACKTGKRTRAEALEELQNSLRLLRAGYFDVYQLHGVEAGDVDTVLGKGGAAEALLEAREKGWTRYIGFTTHEDGTALRLLESRIFDTMLFPVNWACRIKNGLGQRALQEAARQNLGRVAIKALAHREKEPQDDGYPKCWYRPIIGDEGLAELALRFTLSQDVHTAVSPGDIRMLRLALSIMEKYQGSPPPLSAEESGELEKRAAGVEHTIFAA
jgi:aryl-alcohol dehydrogenase-like predicted oxidoreductase